MGGLMHKPIAMLAAAIGLAGSASAQESAPSQAQPAPGTHSEPTFLPPPKAFPRGPRPKGNPGLWVTNSDYPPEATAQKLSGMVAFRLQIGPDGRVEDCTITASSGHDVLDRKTCEVMIQRARFTPALDAQGNAVRGTFASRFRWVYQ
jgi:protein TonB